MDAYHAPKIPEDPRLRDLQRTAAGLLQTVSLHLLAADDRTRLAEALVYLQAAASALVAEEWGPNPLLEPEALLERLTAPQGGELELPTPTALGDRLDDLVELASLRGELRATARLEAAAQADREAKRALAGRDLPPAAEPAPETGPDEG